MAQAWLLIQSIKKKLQPFQCMDETRTCNHLYERAGVVV